MADSRRDYVYVPPRDTGLPLSLPRTPVAHAVLHDSDVSLNSEISVGGTRRGGTTGGTIFGSATDAMAGAVGGLPPTISDHSDEAQRNLDTEIRRIQVEIGALSARRSRRVRADIHTRLSTVPSQCNYNDDNVPSANKTAPCPTRTSSTPGNGRRKGELELNEHINKYSGPMYAASSSDRVSAVDGKGGVWGSSEAPATVDPAPQTPTVSHGNPSVASNVVDDDSHAHAH